MAWFSNRPAKPRIYAKFERDGDSLTRGPFHFIEQEDGVWIGVRYDSPMPLAHRPPDPNFAWCAAGKLWNTVTIFVK